jgi:hypothetical protein
LHINIRLQNIGYTEHSKTLRSRGWVILQRTKRGNISTVEPNYGAELMALWKSSSISQITVINSKHFIQKAQ